MASRRSLVLLALLGVVLGMAPPAAGHTQIRRATPGPAEAVEGALDAVVLEFLDPVATAPEITVSAPDGETVPGLEPAELIAADVAVARFDPLTIPGTYRVDYTFVALDGDEQVSAHTFTFEPDGDDLSVRPILAAIVGAIVVALLVAAVIGRRRSGA